jgi:hypothetical protein
MTAPAMSLRQGSEHLKSPFFGLTYAPFRGMNGVHKTDGGQGGLAVLHIPANRTAASHFGKMDAAVIISVAVGLVAAACLLGFVLL